MPRKKMRRGRKRAAPPPVAPPGEIEDAPAVPDADGDRQESETEFLEDALELLASVREQEAENDYRQWIMDEVSKMDIEAGILNADEVAELSTPVDVSESAAEDFGSHTPPQPAESDEHDHDDRDLVEAEINSVFGSPDNYYSSENEMPNQELRPVLVPSPKRRRRAGRDSKHTAMFGSTPKKKARAQKKPAASTDEPVPEPPRRITRSMSSSASARVLD